MYIMNGVVYASNPTKEIKVLSIKVLDDFMMIITFSSGEKKLFDVTKLFSMPAFLILEDPDVYKSAAVEHGVVVWKNGELDIAPEYLYENSYTYNEMLLV